MYPPNAYLCYQCSFVIEGNRVDLGHAKSRAPLEGGAEPGMVLRIMNYEPNRSQGTDLFGHVRTVHRMALTYLMNALSEQVHTGIQNLASARARLLYHETGKRGYSELK